MTVTQYNGFWIATDVYLNQDQRDYNAGLIAVDLLALNWTRESIAGILGNMDVESTMNPALIEGRNVHTLIDNNTCLQINNSTGVGLVQWTGHTTTPPVGQKLASFAIRYNKEWYDGQLQTFRLQREYEEDLQFDHGTVDGVSWDWETYVTSTDEPEQLAKVWQYLYERGGIDTNKRQERARYYYNRMGRIDNPWLLFMLNKNQKGVKRRCITI